MGPIIDPNTAHKVIETELIENDTSPYSFDFAVPRA